MPVTFDAIYYVEEPPEIEFRSGLFRVRYQIGKNAQFEVVMSPHVFLRARRCSGRVLDEFESGKSVVDFASAGGH